MSNKKGKAKKIILKIFAIILCISVAIAIVTVIANTIVVKANIKLAQSFEKVQYENQLMPEKDKDGVLTFTTDNDLRVMQLTDVHIGGGWMSSSKDAMALNSVAAMIKVEKPDLVIITGDMVYPVPFQAGTFNNLSGAKIIANLFESLEVYWLPVFGNHDTEAYAYYNRDKIAEFYASGEFEHCLLNIENITDDIDGACNSVINVKNTEGFITQSLYSLDSHSYIDGDFLGLFWKYDGVHENQIAWYKSCVEKYNKQNLDLINEKFADKKDEMTEKYGVVKSLAFFHIPTSEYLTAWNEYVEAGYKNTDNVTFKYGTVGESGQLVYHSIHEDMLFETMQELGSTKGIFCGHDHLNNFSIDYKGIRLTYGFSIDYLAYSGISELGSQRGCTMITVKPDGTFDCVAENYYQDKYATDTREEVTMQTLNNDNPNVDSDTTPTTETKTTESTTESTTVPPETSTKAQETAAKPVKPNKTETTTKKQATVSKGNSRSAKTKKEMLALTNLSESDLEYYETKGLGHTVYYMNLQNAPKGLDRELVPGFQFVSIDKKKGIAEEGYYLYQGKLHYYETEYEYDRILERNKWTDKDFQNNVEAMKTYKCQYCGDHNCRSLEYEKMENGVIHNVHYTNLSLCPAIKAEKIKCQYCDKILIDISDDRRLTDTEHYCDGACIWGFGFSGESA